MGRECDLFWTVDGACSAHVVWHQLHERPGARLDRGALVFSAGKTVRQLFRRSSSLPSCSSTRSDVSRRHRRHRILSASTTELSPLRWKHATINPRDASAHYQLGLIYQYRRQYGEAISRFQKAVEIAHDETDAHFQLGRIAREQNRLQDAINHFSVVLEQDDKHAHSEIWREVGATYLAASMFTEAKDALAKVYRPSSL